MLELEGVSAQYGKRPVLRGVSLKVGKGEVISLVGANAAGKTTTLRTIMGLKEPTAGTIRFAGEDITALSTAERVRRGVTLSPEGRQIFAKFTVMENLIMGGYHRADRNHLQDDIARVLEMFPRLAERRDQRAGLMSGGEQQMLAIGRALVSRPKCLLLDEPTLGLAPIMVEEIEHITRALARSGMAILLAEQNASMALSVADRAYVLESGNLSLEGRAEALKETAEVRKLYLGA
ncbi:MAG TPA: ABC transporter ATP-binding protein [Alphaproteobacteria bacterium]|nr:ABC transporter ATP-binding protein [Alphaproteobacteria bacterium]